jgi:hypothetical protein
LFSVAKIYFYSGLLKSVLEFCPGKVGRITSPGDIKQPIVIETGNRKLETVSTHDSHF